MKINTEAGMAINTNKQTKATTFHIDSANKQAIPTVGESEARQSASMPSVTDDDSVKQKM